MSSSWIFPPFCRYLRDSYSHHSLLPDAVKSYPVPNPNSSGSDDSVSADPSTLPYSSQSTTMFLVLSWRPRSTRPPAAIRGRPVSIWISRPSRASLRTARLRPAWIILARIPSNSRRSSNLSQLRIIFLLPLPLFISSRSPRLPNAYSQLRFRCVVAPHDWTLLRCSALVRARIGHTNQHRRYKCCVAPPVIIIFPALYPLL
jgi:hypothetical protein